MLLSNGQDVYRQLARCPWFMDEVDAVIIGTPPRQHFPLVKACLALDKHVLVEKPMMMHPVECEEVIRLAEERGRILNVMHSFQFSNGMRKLYQKYQAGELGNIQSILELQLSNRTRRLPSWYQDLPLGLFYDEAAHFFYGARRFGGPLKVLNAHAVFNKNGDQTPKFLQAQLYSGSVPVQMYMNFNSPICEWGLLLIGEKKIAVYDYFKDILVLLDNDGQHYAKDVLKTSICFSFRFWSGFFKNGVRMCTHRLLYGHDECICRFVKAVETGKSCFELSPELGMEVVAMMNEVVSYAKGEK